MSKRSFQLILVVVAVLVMCTGCDRIYRLLQKEGAEEKDLIGDVVPLESNAKIEEIQRLLNIFGYSVGRPDGKLGARTRNAVIKFQEDNGLAVTRFVDSATWDKLSSFSRIGLIENGELSYINIQKALNHAGFDCGTPDGRIGPRTKAAILNFQKGAGLKPDGRIGYKTLTQLANYVDLAEIEPFQTDSGNKKKKKK